MKILSREIKVNEDTFAPEMILTISMPMELAENALELMKQQEPLGKEFEKVLNDNLWNLYED